MVVEFTENAFTTKDFKLFNLLFQLCTSRDRYEVIADFVKVKDFEVFKRLDRDDQDIIVRNFNVQMTKQSNKKADGKKLTHADYYIAIDDRAGENAFNLEEAMAFFNQSVSIILENSLNDSYFIKAMIGYFDDNGIVKKHLNNNWLDFENAGGCTNVENFIKGKLAKYDHLQKANEIYYRAIVILDSDRGSAQPHKDKKHGELLKFLRLNGIRFHVLEKRMMENYMPDEVIKEYRHTAGLSQWIDSFLHLSPRQKDFINFTRGFSKKDGSGVPLKQRHELDTDVIALYNDVSDNNYRRLDDGFKIEDFKTTFPKNFTQNPLVNYESLGKKLEHQDDPAEYKHILIQIEQLL